MSGRIKHTGVIERVGEGHLVVRIEQQSACAACSAKGHCTAADKKEKMVDVYNFDASEDYRVGETVTVIAATQVGMKAVNYAFSIPFIVLVAVLFAAMRLSGSEAVAAASAIAAVGVYYFALYLMRGKLREKLSFSVERENI